MAEDDEYELVPHKVVSDLKREVEDLKNNPFGASAVGHTMQESMNALAHSINDLLQMFKDATDELKHQETESNSVTTRLDPLLDKLDMIIDQNHKIAKGILTVADMLQEHVRHKIPMPGPQPFSPGSQPFSAPPPQQQWPQAPRIPPPPQRPNFRAPFPEFSPMQDPFAQPRPSAPMPMGQPMGPSPMNMSEQTIPPAPSPPSSLKR